MNDILDWDYYQNLLDTAPATWPSQILEKICSFLPTSSDKLQFSLVHSNWNPIGQEVLWRFPTFPTEKSLQLFLNLVRVKRSKLHNIRGLSLVVPIEDSLGNDQSLLYATLQGRSYVFKSLHHENSHHSLKSDPQILKFLLHATKNLLKLSYYGSALTNSNLIEFLQFNSHIQSLEIVGAPQKEIRLGAYFRSFKNLKSLTLRFGADISPDAWKAIQRNSHQLEVFEVYANNLGHDLENVLLNSKNLIKLTVIGNNNLISDTTVAQIAKNNPNLRSLSIESTSLTSTCAAHVLENCHRLTKLELTCSTENISPSKQKISVVNTRTLYSLVLKNLHLSSACYSNIFLNNPMLSLVYISGSQSLTNSNLAQLSNSSIFLEGIMLQKCLNITNRFFSEISKFHSSHLKILKVLDCNAEFTSDLNQKLQTFSNLQSLTVVGHKIIRKSFNITLNPGFNPHDPSTSNSSFLSTHIDTQEITSVDSDSKSTTPEHVHSQLQAQTQDQDIRMTSKTISASNTAATNDLIDLSDTNITNNTDTAFNTDVKSNDNRQPTIDAVLSLLGSGLISNPNSLNNRPSLDYLFEASNSGDNRNASNSSDSHANSNLSDNILAKDSSTTDFSNDAVSTFTVGTSNDSGNGNSNGSGIDITRNVRDKGDKDSGQLVNIANNLDTSIVNTIHPPNTNSHGLDIDLFQAPQPSYNQNSHPETMDITNQILTDSRALNLKNLQVLDEDFQPFSVEQQAQDDDKFNEIYGNSEFDNQNYDTILNNKQLNSNQETEINGKFQDEVNNEIRDEYHNPEMHLDIHQSDGEIVELNDDEQFEAEGSWIISKAFDDQLHLLNKDEWKDEITFFKPNNSDQIGNTIVHPETDNVVPLSPTTAEMLSDGPSFKVDSFASSLGQRRTAQISSGNMLFSTKNSTNDNALNITPTEQNNVGLGFKDAKETDTVFDNYRTNTKLQNITDPINRISPPRKVQNRKSASYITTPASFSSTQNDALAALSDLINNKQYEAKIVKEKSQQDSYNHLATNKEPENSKNQHIRFSPEERSSFIDKNEEFQWVKSPPNIYSNKLNSHSTVEVSSAQRFYQKPSLNNAETNGTVSPGTFEKPNSTEFFMGRFNKSINRKNIYSMANLNTSLNSTQGANIDGLQLSTGYHQRSHNRYNTNLYHKSNQIDESKEKSFTSQSPKSQNINTAQDYKKDNQFNRSQPHSPTQALPEHTRRLSTIISASDSAISLSNYSKPTSNKRLMLELIVETPVHGQQKLLLYKNEDPSVVAEEFCNVHGMPELASGLKALVTAKLERKLRRMTEYTRGS